MQRILPFILALTASTALALASTSIQDEPEARISAQFLKPDGTPAGGAKWTIRGWGRNTEAVRQHGRPDDWENLVGTLDDEGRIDLRFVSPQAYQYVFNVHAEGFAQVSWRFPSIKPTEEKLLGAIELEPECLIKGRIVGPDGEVLSDRAWRIRARAKRQMSASYRNPAQTIISLEQGSERFVVNGLPSGEIEFQISLAGARARTEFQLDLEPGKDLERDFVFDVEAATSPKITFSLNAGPFRDFQALRDEHIEIVAADGTRIDVMRFHPSFPQLEAIPEVEGPFTIKIDDPNFEPIEHKNIAKGELVRLRLVGSASLKLDVRDPSGEPVPRFELFLATPGGLNESARVLDGKTDVEDGVIPGIIPGAYQMTVRAPNAIARLDVPEIQAKEVREITVALEPIVRARGLVFYPDGEPVVGAEVMLIKTAAQDDSSDSPILLGRSSGPLPSYRTLAGRAQTDADGMYSIDVPETGRYLIIARETGKTRVISDPFDVDESSVARDLELPRGALLEGFVALPDHLKDAPWEIFFEGETYHPDLDRMRGAPQLDSRGEFRSVGLPAGKTNVYLRNPQSRTSLTPSGRPRDSYLVGTVELEEGGVHKATFAFEGDLPSRVTVKLTSTERLGEAAEVHLMPNDASSPNSRVVLSGSVESLSSEVVAPGVYAIMVKGDGWAVMKHDPVTIDPGTVVEVPIEVETMECTVQIFVGGKPAAGQSLRLWSGTWQGLTVKCDDEGFVTARIDAGILKAQVVPDFSAGVIPRPETLDVTWPLETESLHFD